MNYNIKTGEVYGNLRDISNQHFSDIGVNHADFLEAQVLERSVCAHLCAYLSQATRVIVNWKTYIPKNWKSNRLMIDTSNSNSRLSFTVTFCECTDIFPPPQTSYTLVPALNINSYLKLYHPITFPVIAVPSNYTSYTHIPPKAHHMLTDEVRNKIVETVVSTDMDRIHSIKKLNKLIITYGSKIPVKTWADLATFRD